MTENIPPEVQHAVTQAIPQSMQPVVDAIGVKAALSIIRYFGGRRLHVPLPSTITENHALVWVLGEPLAHRLAKAMGGCELQVPDAKQAERRLLTHEIVRRWRERQPMTQISKQVGIGWRQVKRIIDRARLEAERVVN